MTKSRYARLALASRTAWRLQSRLWSEGIEERNRRLRAAMLKERAERP